MTAASECTCRIVGNLQMSTGCELHGEGEPDPGLTLDEIAAVVSAHQRNHPIAVRERQRVLDEVERNLRRILADERADQTHTVRDVLTVLIENALPKWREGP